MTEDKLSSLYERVFSQFHQWILSGYWDDMCFDDVPVRIITAMKEEDYSLVETLLEENQEDGSEESGEHEDGSEGNFSYE